MVRLRLRANGPIVLQGSVRVEREDGTLVRECESLAFCRCGTSGEMPFCDGSHRVSAFRD